MAAFETSTTQDPCPTDEELAAFLDGTLTKAERSRITAHLADCESCYEIFAGAVHFQQESAPQSKAAKVVPFPSLKEDGRPAKRWWLPATVAAVLAIGFGLIGYQAFLAPPKTGLADLVAQVPGQVRSEHAYQPIRRRGGGDSVSFGEAGPDVLAGVFLVDIERDRRQGKVDPDRLTDLGAKLKDIPGLLASQTFAAYAQKIRSGNPAARTEVLRSLPAQETELDGFLSASLYFDFGKWAETGRLAALASSSDFFSRSNKRFLAKLLKEPLFQEEGVTEHLAEIQRIWDRGNLHAADYQQLADHFTKIIRHYDV